MEGLNKIISLFLGLVVVIILFAIITGRFTPFKSKTTKVSNAKITATLTPTPKEQKKFLGLFNIGGKKPTMTPTPTSKTVVVDTTKESNSYTQVQSPTVGTNVKVTTSVNTKTTSVTSIPATGSATALLPIMSSALLAGIYLRRKK